MTVHNLDHLNLTVQDFDDTVGWYRRVFGFELVEDGVQDGVRWGVIRSERAMLCIYEHPELKPPEKGSDGRHGVSHFALRITDRAAWEAVVDREQLQLGYGGLFHWPHSLAWYVQDPTGYEIEVALWNDDEIHFAA